MLESDYGFVVWRFDGRNIYIIEMYILPEHRKNGNGRALISQLEEIAVTQGAEAITAGIYLEDKCSTTTVIAALMGGFQIYSANGGVLQIAKVIKKNNSENMEEK